MIPAQFNGKYYMIPGRDLSCRDATGSHGDHRCASARHHHHESRTYDTCKAQRDRAEAAGTGPSSASGPCDRRGGVPAAQQDRIGTRSNYAARTPASWSIRTALSVLAGALCAAGLNSQWPGTPSCHSRRREDCDPRDITYLHRRGAYSAFFENEEEPARPVQKPRQGHGERKRKRGGKGCEG